MYIEDNTHNAGDIHTYTHTNIYIHNTQYIYNIYTIRTHIHIHIQICPHIYKDRKYAYNKDLVTSRANDDRNDD